MATTSAPSVTPSPRDRPPAKETAGAAVLLLGFSDSDAARLAASPEIDAAVFVAAEESTAHEMLTGRQIAVLCLGSELGGTRARDFLTGALARHPDYQGCNVVLAAGPELEVFQDLVAADRLYYLTSSPPPHADVVHIVESAVEHDRTRRAQPAAYQDDERAAATQRVLELTEPLAREPTLERALALTVDVACELAAADRATLLLYDRASETLWTREMNGKAARRESAAAGLVSFAVRTRTPVRLECVGSDPRYDPEADNEGGPRDERFLAVPVVDQRAGRTWAVLVTLRSAARPPFTEADQEQIALLAEHVAPALGRCLLQSELEERAVSRHGARGTAVGQLFRTEALDHYQHSVEEQGHVLEIAPGWTKWAYRLLLLAAAAALVFSLVGSINEYASGTAVVRLEDQIDVTAPLAGTVVTVEVEPGRRVAAGDVLVRLYEAQESAELDRIRREFELGLVQRLRSPDDLGVERNLGALRAQKTLAERRLDQRSVRAPRAGSVGDVWIQPGQHLAPGQVILSLNGDDPRLKIVALLPGRYRPLIEPGMPLRLELRGYRYAYQHLTVESIGDEVVGPAETRRFLGPGIGDAIPLTGPVVFVTARLPSPTFEVAGRSFTYHDGILGVAEVRVRSEKILFAMVPGLKALWNHSDG